MAHTTSGGASIEPKDAPILKMPPASPRSLAGNHSDTAFMPAGLADPSASPSRPRSAAKPCQLVAMPCAMQMTDQAAAKIAKPYFKPITSST